MCSGSILWSFQESRILRVYSSAILRFQPLSSWPRMLARAPVTILRRRVEEYLKKKVDESKGYKTVTFWGRSPKAATYFHVYPIVQNPGTCSDLVGMEDRKRILCSEWIFVQLRIASPVTGKEWREWVLENTGRHLAQYVTCVLNRLNAL